MKKITFVQREDDTSYDPVSTFFTKKKQPNVPKPISKGSSMSKTPVEKRMLQTKQQKDRSSRQINLQPQKIGQKGGSGYIPKKVPYSSNSKTRQQNIYNNTQSKKINSINKVKNSTVTQNIRQQQKQSIKSAKVNAFVNSQKDLKNQFYQQQQKNEHINDHISDNQQNNYHQRAQQHQLQQKQGSLPKVKTPSTILYKQVKKQTNQGSRKNIGNSVNSSKKSNTVINQKQKSNTNIKKSISSSNSNNKSKQNNLESTDNNTQKQSLKNSQKVQTLTKRISQLQTYERQYLNKIQQLESKEQNFYKIEQKYNKLVKDHKQCAQKNKDINTIRQQLKQKEQALKKLLNKNTTPYDKKREYYLTNQLYQLKKQNRNLVLRLKNYKGTDVVQLAIQRNKDQICRQFDIQYQEQLSKMNVQMESNASQLISQVYEYLEKKSKPKNFDFLEEQKFLLSLNKIAENLSLTYLEKYQVSPLPKSNDQCKNMYAEIQKYRENHPFFTEIKSIIDKQDLNFAITESNLQVLNHLQENNGQLQNLKEQLKNSKSPKKKGNALKNKQQKMLNYFNIYQKRSNFSTVCHIQSLCYFTFLKQWIQNHLKQTQSQLANLYARIKEMKDIFDLGGSTARQSLYLYLQANIEDFCLLVPNLTLKIKEIKSTYLNLYKGKI